MTRKYLLPCSCGQQVPVDAGHAGLVVHCGCGQTLQVPTLRGLSRLPEASPATVAATSSWGRRQRATLLGVIVAVLGFAGSVYLHQTMPEMPTRELIWLRHPEKINEFDVVETVELWNQLQVGIAQPAPDLQMSLWQQNVRVQQRLVWLCGLLGLFGVLLAIGAPLGLLGDRPATLALEPNSLGAEKTVADLERTQVDSDSSGPSSPSAHS